MQPRIIIVTHDTQLRNALKRACSGHGCRVETADSIEIASKITRLMTVSVVIVDATVDNEGDGVALAIAMHELNPAAAYFLLVDEESSGIIVTVINVPWLRFVYKPVSILQFAADVIAAIAKITAKG